MTVKTEFFNCLDNVEMIFENVYIQLYILHITYNQWRKLPLPFGWAEEGQKISTNLSILYGKMNFEQTYTQYLSTLKQIN